MILIDSYPYDLMVRGELVFEAEVTHHPIEDGSTTTDHRIIQPMVFTLECIVSDSPIGEIAQHESRRVDDVTVAVFGSDQTPLPSDEAYNRLLEIHNTSKLVTIEIPVASRTAKPGKRTFANMWLTSLSMPMDRETSGGLFFSASWEQVVIARNNRVTVRTATPGGRPGSKTRATVGQAFRVDREVIWRQGKPPGGALPPDPPGKAGHPWAMIAVTFTGGKSGSKNVYRYAGEASDGVTAPLPRYPVTTGKILAGAEFNDFLSDMARDIKEKQARELQELHRETDRKTSETIDAIEKDPNSIKHLPPGVDLNRFTEPAPKTFEDPRPSVTNNSPTDLKRFQTPGTPTFGR